MTLLGPVVCPKCKDKGTLHLKLKSGKYPYFIVVHKGSVQHHLNTDHISYLPILVQIAVKLLQSMSLFRHKFKGLEYSDGTKVYDEATIKLLDEEIEYMISCTAFLIQFSHPHKCNICNIRRIALLVKISALLDQAREAADGRADFGSLFFQQEVQSLCKSHSIRYVARNLGKLVSEKLLNTTDSLIMLTYVTPLIMDEILFSRPNTVMISTSSDDANNTIMGDCFLCEVADYLDECVNTMIKNDSYIPEYLTALDTSIMSHVCVPENEPSGNISEVQ